MAVDYFSHESIDGASAGSDIVQYLRTLALLVERLIDRGDLASDPPDSVQQLFFSSIE